MEARYVAPGKTVDWTADAAYSAGAVVQLPDGRAGVVSCTVASGKPVAVWVEGIFEVAKTASMVVLIGSRLYWDHSANKCHLLHQNDKDFFLGAAQADATSAATTVVVDLNSAAPYTHHLGQGFQHIKVCTAGLMVGALGHGEGASFRFDVTAEAQKLDALSTRGFAPLTPAIVDALICINVAPDDAAVDVNVGLANGTDASDADQITESLFVHLDGNDANIDIESDDGMTEVAAADSGVDWSAGTPFLVQFDLRNWSDIQVYINGVNVLPSSVFKLNAATGPLKLLAHAEKSSNDSPLNMTVLRLGARTFQSA